MYLELVKSLSKEQIDALEAAGIARSIVSNWKHEKRIPTRPQTLLLASVCNVDPIELEKELMLIEASPEQRSLFQKILKVPASAVAMSFLILGTITPGEKANAANDLGRWGAVYTPYTSWQVRTKRKIMVWLFGYRFA